MHNTSIQKNHLAGILIVVAGAILYGLYPPISRALYNDGANFIFVVLGLNLFRLTALLIASKPYWRYLWPSKGQRGIVLLGGLCQATSVLCIILSLKFISGPVMIIIIMTHSLMLLFYTNLTGERALDFNSLATSITALIGLTLVLNLWTAEQTTNLTGILLACIAAVAVAIRQQAFSQQSNSKHPSLIGAQTYIITATVLIIIACFYPPTLPHNPISYAWLGLGGITMSIATLCTFYAIAHLGAFTLSMIGKVEPIFTALFSVLLINEVLETSQYIGILVVIASLLVFQKFDHKKHPPALKRKKSPINT